MNYLSNSIVFCRWRKEYGGMRVDTARRLKELEQENIRLKLWRHSRLESRIKNGE